MFETILIVLIGVLMILAAFFNWKWWFESRRVKFIVKILSRNGTRVLYMVLGVMFLGIGLNRVLNIL